MGIRSSVRQAAMFASILMISSDAGAQNVEGLGGTVQRTLTPGETTGIQTDRLTKSQLKAWASILEVVLAKDGEGRPVCPTLHELYHQADTGSYEVQIEISTQRATLCAAGVCRIELRSEGVPKEVILIRLNLGMIDRAVASELTRRADGFIPFAGLTKKQRYAEVLGHELAHVVRLLTDLRYRGLYRERQALADTGSEDIQAIRRLTRLIEQTAEAAEVEIWSELAAGRGKNRGR
jgi:hypothetical protein